MTSNTSTYNSDNLQKSNNEEISLKNLISKFKRGVKFLLSKWIIIVVIGIAGAFAGYFYAQSIKPIYNATCTFVLEDGSSGGGEGRASLASLVGIDGDSGGGLFQGDNIIQLYKSRIMVRQTLLSNVDYNGKQVLLMNYFIDFTGLKQKLEHDPKLKLHFVEDTGQVFTRAQDSIINLVTDNILKNYLEVSKPDRKLSMFDVEVRSTDEFFSKSFNDKIVKNVNDFYIKTKTAKSLFNIAVLQHQTDSLRAVINGALTASAAVIDATPNLNQSRQLLRLPVQRSQLNNEGNRSLLSQLTVNLELSKISLRKETPLIEVVDKPILPLQKIALGKKKAIMVGFAVLCALGCFFLILQKIFIDILKGE